MEERKGDPASGSELVEAESTTPPTDASAPAGEVVDSAADGAEASEEEGPADAADVYRVALARYLENDAPGALQIVDEALARPEIDDKIRDKLERLQRRAAGHIKKETARVKRLTPEKKEVMLESAVEAVIELAEAEDAGSDDSTSADASDAIDQPTLDESAADPEDAPAEDEADSAQDSSPEAASAEDEPESSDAVEADEAEAEAGDEGEEEASSAEAEPIPEARPASNLAETQAAVDVGNLGETQVDASDLSSAEGAALQESGGAGAPPRRGERRGPRPKRRPPSGPPSQHGGPGQQVARRPRRGPGPPSSVAPSHVGRDLERMRGEIEALNKTMRGVENHTMKVAEAYQRISRQHQRKEQAYDQLYEELRQYKDNFLLAAQKPLFKDMILLYDGVSRQKKAFEEREDEPTKEDMITSLQHVLDEILEVLYRKDIELIEERPDLLNIDFQKPIRRIETDDPKEDRKIDQVVREGFRIDGVVLRPQEVVVKRCLKERES